MKLAAKEKIDPTLVTLEAGPSFGQGTVYIARFPDGTEWTVSPTPSRIWHVVDRSNRRRIGHVQAPKVRGEQLWEAVAATYNQRETGGPMDEIFGSLYPEQMPGEYEPISRVSYQYLASGFGVKETRFGLLPDPILWRAPSRIEALRPALSVLQVGLSAGTYPVVLEGEAQP